MQGKLQRKPLLWQTLTIKCDGRRPACSRCIQHKVECSYIAAEGETHSLALKRKHGTLLEEVDQLKELFSLMHKRSHQEAHEIFKRIRSTNDPIAILQSIKDAELLLSRPLPGVYNDPRIQRLDADSIQNSSIKVPARPWTMVAGDGIVSELITNFFENDHGYLVPLIHRGSFLKEMRTRSAREAKYCSPTLVNSICALKCVNAHPPW